MQPTILSSTVFWWVLANRTAATTNLTDDDGTGQVTRQWLTTNRHDGDGAQP